MHTQGRVSTTQVNNWKRGLFSSLIGGGLYRAEGAGYRVKDTNGMVGGKSFCAMMLLEFSFRHICIQKKNRKKKGMKGKEERREKKSSWSRHVDCFVTFFC